MYETLTPVKWMKDHVVVLDQTLLPAKEEFIEIRDIEKMWDVIQRLCVRGAVRCCGGNAEVRRGA